MSEASLNVGYTIQKAEFIGFIVESFLYGIFLCVWIASIYILLDRYRLGSAAPINRTLMGGSLLIFACTTTHWVLDAVRIVQALLYESSDPLNLLYYLANFKGGINMGRAATVVVAGFLLDCFLVYRVWMIWGRQIVVAIPLMICMGGYLVCGIGLLNRFTVDKLLSDITLPASKHWIIANATLTMATNLISSGLIAYRLLRVEKNLKALGGSKSLMPFLLIIIESAAIYSSIGLTTFIACILGSNLQSTIICIQSGVIGITFSMIIVRVGLSFSSNAFTRGSPNTANTVSSPRNVLENAQQVSTNLSYAMRPINVQVATHVERDADGAFDSTGKSEFDMDDKSSGKYAGVPV